MAGGGAGRERPGHPRPRERRLQPPRAAHSRPLADRHQHRTGVVPRASGQGWGCARVLALVGDRAVSEPPRTGGERAATATASWLRPVEAAAALGVTPEAIRARIRRGTLETRPGNDGRLRVLVPLTERAASTTPNGRDHNADATRPGGDRARPGAAEAELVEELKELRAKLTEARERAARAEGRAEELAAALAAEQARGEATLAKAEARADRLEAELRESRRPWLAKVLEGLRRKGS
jgi:hypothetical protein